MRRLQKCHSAPTAVTSNCSCEVFPFPLYSPIQVAKLQQSCLVFPDGMEHTQLYVWLRGVTRIWESSTGSRVAGYCEGVAGTRVSGSSCVHMSKVQGCWWVMFPAAWVDLALCNHTEWRNHSMLCFPGSSSKSISLFSKSRLSSLSSCNVGLSTQGDSFLGLPLHQLGQAGRRI